MKIGIMQPYFLSYLGYYSLIRQVDRYLVFDTAQYIYHGWINRNRILKPGGADWQYIQVPVKKHARTDAIKDVLIDNEKPWRERILGQIAHYKKRAPFYRKIVEWLKETWNGNFVSIADLDIAMDRAVCKYLGIETPMERFSEMHLAIKPPQAPDEWALNICQALGDVDEYVNAPGGATFFDARKYEQAGIRLRFLDVQLPSYSQMGHPFLSGLSVLDAMMFCTPEDIRAMLDACKS
ncbi:MAG: WbqC family protein [Selenomonas sp.]|nr:WbqC family protein [Selenomonas sp.]